MYGLYINVKSAKQAGTWIYNRIKADSLNEGEYKKFLDNEEELAKEYGFNIEIQNKNKVDLRVKDVSYDGKKVKVLQESSEKDEIIFILTFL